MEHQSKFLMEELAGTDNNMIVVGYTGARHPGRAPYPTSFIIYRLRATEDGIAGSVSQ